MSLIFKRDVPKTTLDMLVGFYKENGPNSRGLSPHSDEVLELHFAKLPSLYSSNPKDLCPRLQGFFTPADTRAVVTDLILEKLQDMYKDGANAQVVKYISWLVANYPHKVEPSRAGRFKKLFLNALKSETDRLTKNFKSAMKITNGYRTQLPSALYKARETISAFKRLLLEDIIIQEQKGLEVIGLPQKNSAKVLTRMESLFNKYEEQFESRGKQASALSANPALIKPSKI